MRHTIAQHSSINSVAKGLPRQPGYPPNGVEVAVAAEDRKGVLAAESGDPNIVAGDGLSNLLQFGADVSVMPSGLLIDVENSKPRQVLGQPVLVVGSVTGLRDSVSVFSQ